MGLLFLIEAFMKKSLFFIAVTLTAILSGCIQSNAYSFEPDEATCYVFNKNSKLLNKGPCEVIYTSGAGGSETLIKYKGKNFLFAEVQKVDNEGNVTYPDSGYIRDSKNFRKAKTDEEISKIPFERTVFCKVDKSVDMCYLPKN